MGVAIYGPEEADQEERSVEDPRAEPVESAAVERIVYQRGLEHSAQSGQGLLRNQVQGSRLDCGIQQQDEQERKWFLHAQEEGVYKAKSRSL